MRFIFMSKGVRSLHATAAGWSFGPRVTQATTIVSVTLVVLAAVAAHLGARRPVTEALQEE
jgi:hypothetical protein